MNARILAVGSLKESWQREACAEYLKRLSRYGKYETVEVPDEPEPQNGSEALSEKVLLKEGQALLKQLKSTDYVVALCINGKQLSSERLADALRDWESTGRRVVLIIGGSLGLSKEVIDRADYKLMTIASDLAARFGTSGKLAGVDVAALCAEEEIAEIYDVDATGTFVGGSAEVYPTPTDTNFLFDEFISKL